MNTKMSNIDSIKNYPEISFIDDTTLESVQLQMINDYQDKYYELTGNRIALGKADPNRLVMYACSLQIYQAMQYIDSAGKKNFLKYAYEGYLENLGAWKGISRSLGKASKTTIRFTLSQAQTSAIIIPMGTRATAGDNIYFYTDEAAEIPIGELSIEVGATCTVIGSSTNGYEIGKINILVDPIPYIAAIENITVTEGGADVESDENLAERIFLAPSSYSVAGPDDAYIYWAKTLNPSIIDVKVTSPSAVVVDIRFILSDGELPGEAVISEMQEFLSDKKIRPLTDHVQVSAPDTVDYAINVEYWINESDKSIASTIQSKINTAIENYKLWQRTKIGRDINPSVLNQMIISAGAKRAVVNSPVFTTIPETSVANLTTSTVTYGGLESD